MRVTRQKVVTMCAALLITSGVALLAWQPSVAYITRQQGARQNLQALQQINVVAQKDLELGEPAHISIPRLNVNLSVLPGSYNANRTWTLDRTHAFSMSLNGSRTPTPIIYGHNIPAVFQSLDGVAANEQLIITDNDGKQYLFAYVNDVVVAPDDTSILQKKMPNTILVMTCTGMHFEQRRILQFRYIGTQPSVVYERDDHGYIA